MPIFDDRLPLDNEFFDAMVGRCKIRSATDDGLHEDTNASE
jgi:hypothetical protein